MVVGAVLALLLIGSCIAAVFGDGSPEADPAIPSQWTPHPTPAPQPTPTGSQLQEIVLAITDACIDEANRLYSAFDPERVDYINACEIMLIGRDYLREYCSTLDMRYKERNGRWNCV